MTLGIQQNHVERMLRSSPPLTAPVRNRVAAEGRVSAGHRGMSAMPANRGSYQGWLLSDRAVVPGGVHLEGSVQIRERPANSAVGDDRLELADRHLDRGASVEVDDPGLSPGGPGNIPV